MWILNWINSFSLTVMMCSICCYTRKSDTWQEYSRTESSERYNKHQMCMYLHVQTCTSFIYMNKCAVCATHKKKTLSFCIKVCNSPLVFNSFLTELWARDHHQEVGIRSCLSPQQKELLHLTQFCWIGVSELVTLFDRAHQKPPMDTEITEIDCF